MCSTCMQRTQWPKTATIRCSPIGCCEKWTFIENPHFGQRGTHSGRESPGASIVTVSMVSPF